jgi:cell filamentation protein, protein adenylyltransferase
VTSDKYGIENDPYCYPGSTTLINLLGLRDDESLGDAERDLTLAAAMAIDFVPPPYDLPYLQTIHRHLFGEVYEWAGQLRAVDISKDTTRFCTASRIQPEADKLFRVMRDLNWFEGLSRTDLITHVAEIFGDFNVVHPFREGNGRTQRILFDQMVINAGYEISWADVGAKEWIAANVAAYQVDYGPLAAIFDRCIGDTIPVATSDLA